jgi:hypothetical protein
MVNPAMPEAGPAAAPAVVDRPELRDELVCPLCGYSLRGRSDVGGEPRCPECGYRFEWVELLRARQHRHPYLFEHHPGFGGFFRTLFAGWRPRRFWSSLNAGHQVRPAGILFYALLESQLTLLSVYGGHVLAMAVVAFRRASRSQPYGDSAGLLVSPAFWQEAVDRTRSESELITFLAAACAAWPWVTLGALLIFQVSMRRAHVHATHVVRCVVYSGDVFVWSGLGLVAGGALGVLSPYRYLGGARPIVMCILPAVLLAGYRLGVAYRRYLRFDHAWSTVLASQVIYALAVITVLAVFYDDFFRLLW